MDTQNKPRFFKGTNIQVPRLSVFPIDDTLVNVKVSLSIEEKGEIQLPMDRLVHLLAHYAFEPAKVLQETFHLKPPMPKGPSKFQSVMARFDEQRV